MSSDVIITAPLEASSAKSRRLNPRLIIFILAAAAVVIAAGYAAYKMFGGPSEHAEAAKSAAAAAETYVEAPPMLVNLRTADGQQRFLKLRFIVVAASPDKVDELRSKLPAVLDALQPFLHELRPEDMNGSAALFRIKEEIMSRAADALGPNMVRDILIQDLVQQ